MENINKLIQNTDLSFEMQTRLCGLIANISDEIEENNTLYVECKKLFLAADAALNKAITEDDYEAKMVAAQSIIQSVNDLHEARERIKQLTSKKQSIYKMLMNRQKKDEHNQKSDEHIYVLPRQQVIEFLDAIEEEVDENPDFKTITLAINTSLLKK